MTPRRIMLLVPYVLVIFTGVWFTGKAEAVAGLPSIREETILDGHGSVVKGPDAQSDELHHQLKKPAEDTGTRLHLRLLRRLLSRSIQKNEAKKPKGALAPLSTLVREKEGGDGFSRKSLRRQFDSAKSIQAKVAAASPSFGTAVEVDMNGARHPSLAELTSKVDEFQSGSMKSVEPHQSNNVFHRMLQGNWNEGSWEQFGQDVDGEAADDSFGSSVALSADGSIMAVGAPLHAGGSGHVRVFNLNITTGLWDQMGLDIDGGSAGDWFGDSVALSADGKTVAVGAPYGGNGYTRVYRWDDSNEEWTLMGSNISGVSSGDEFGYSVALSADGEVLAVGAPFYDYNSTTTDIGRVHVYNRNATNDSWDLVQDIIGEAAGDNFGWSVALSEDGSFLAVGAFFNDGNGTDSGHVRVFNCTNGSCLQMGDDIDGEAEYDRSGRSVALSADGTVVAIGADSNDGNGLNSGHVRVYNWNSTAWVKLGKDIDGESAYNYSGCSVDLSSDGKVLAVGAIYNKGFRGHVRVYHYDDSNDSWTKVGSDVDGEAGGDLSGVSVALSADGLILAVGAPYNDGTSGTDSGHVRTFRIPTCSDDWVLTPDLENIQVSFGGSSGASNSELIMPYVMSSCRGYKFTVYEKGCADDAEVPSTVTYVSSTRAPGTTNERENVIVTIDIARDNITESSIFNGTDPSNSVMEMCIRGDLVEDVSGTGTIDSVSFVETELSLTIDMTQGFNVTAIALDRNDATEAEESANLDYEVDSYLCDSSGTNSTDAITQQDDIFICVESKSTNVGINSIDSLTFLQEGVGPSLQLPAIVAGEPNALTTFPYDGSDSKKLIIKSKLLSSFFDSTDPVGVKVDGVVIMQFQDDGTRRLAKTSQSGRTLQQPEDSIAGDVIFGTRFQLAPLEVNTNELNDDSSSPGRSIAGVFILLAHAAVVFAIV